MHTSYGQGLEKTKDAGLRTAPWLKQVQKKYSKQGDLSLTTITYLPIIAFLCVRSAGSDHSGQRNHVLGRVCEEVGSV